jgi:hypothetical protein
MDGDGDEARYVVESWSAALAGMSLPGLDMAMYEKKTLSLGVLCVSTVTTTCKSGWTRPHEAHL